MRIADAIARLSRTVATRPLIAAVTVAVVTFCGAWLVATAAGVPEPVVHDELTQVVMADIFAAGRLCEPTHRFWQHFEANYLLAHPCTQGKYPPALPLLMALGQRLTGEPIVGVWLAGTLMILATAYAMYGWLTPRWALLATVLVALRFGVAGDWAQSYWGGSVGAAGGALVLGAAGWIPKRQIVGDGLALGLGLLLLATSRPYEGLVVSMVLLPALLYGLARSRSWRPYVIVAAAALVVVAAGVTWHGYYNWRVTGSALTLPYSAYERTYSASPIFVWQHARVPPPELRNDQMRAIERYLRFEGERSRRDWPVEKLRSIGLALWDYLKPTLPFALLGLLWMPAWLSRGVRFASLAAGAVIVAVLLELPEAAQRYLSPATAPVFLIVTAGLAGLTARFRWGRAAVGIIVFAFAAAVGAYAIRYSMPRGESTAGWAVKRQIRDQLLQTSGADLVFVRYGSSHNAHREWVYNGAGIDDRPIVWARALDSGSDERLRAYFSDRQAWEVLVENDRVSLSRWQVK